jgi:hypothetical protein
MMVYVEYDDLRFMWDTVGLFVKYEFHVPTKYVRNY